LKVTYNKLHSVGIRPLRRRATPRRAADAGVFLGENHAAAKELFFVTPPPPSTKTLKPPPPPEI